MYSAVPWYPRITDDTGHRHPICRFRKRSIARLYRRRVRQYSFVLLHLTARIFANYRLCLKAGEEAVWYASDQTTELYASTSNLFQPLINQQTTFYGAIRNTNSGCISSLLPVTVNLLFCPSLVVCNDYVIFPVDADCNYTVFV